MTVLETKAYLIEQIRQTENLQLLEELKTILFKEANRNSVSKYVKPLKEKVDLDTLGKTQKHSATSVKKLFGAFKNLISEDDLKEKI